MGLWGLITREELSPEALASGAEPIEWILLTNRSLVSIEQALEVAEHYACRWVIEICQSYCLLCHTFDRSWGQSLGRVRSAA